MRDPVTVTFSTGVSAAAGMMPTVASAAPAIKADLKLRLVFWLYTAFPLCFCAR
jgi:hypothetical protein